MASRLICLSIGAGHSSCTLDATRRSSRSAPANRGTLGIIDGCSIDFVCCHIVTVQVDTR
jgi:hypothetical protein